MASSSEYLDESRKRGVCFYGYRIPGRGVRFGSAYSHDCQREIGKGFVIHPFLPGDLPVTIPFGNVSGSEENEELTFNFPYYPTARAFYQKHAGEIIDYLRRHSDHNVVYSRVIVHTVRKPLAEMFDTLCTEYPKAYVFCFYTPWTGLWLGASPEMLADADGDYFRTLAMAGTMEADKGGPWSDKNKREQKVVADFIRTTLHDAGAMEIHERGGQRVAGPVKHLITEFSARMPEKYHSKTLVSELSPTPALSGTPREKALDLIATHEAYSRSCYGGYCGPRYGHGDFHFWVNLRSMRILGDQCALYVGGGLMPDSDVDSEWEETERKARTLLHIL